MICSKYLTNESIHKYFHFTVQMAGVLSAFCVMDEKSGCSASVSKNFFSDNLLPGH